MISETQQPKRRCSQKSDSDLPDTVLIEILNRLPAKSIFRFKSVSKRWLSLISDPLFPRFYVSRINDLSLPLPWTLLFKLVLGKGLDYLTPPDQEKFYHACSGSSYKSPGFSVLYFPIQEQQRPPLLFQFLASSNGLLLGYSTLHLQLIYYVCNPITRQWLALPPPTCIIQSASVGLISQVEGGIVTRYKVVRLECLSQSTSALSMEIFSSETGEWCYSILSCPQKVNINRSGGPFVFNGILHWFDYLNGIIGYDPYNNSDQLHLLSLPEDRSRDRESERLCNACQGRLRYFEVAGVQVNPSLNVWILQDYEKGEWSLEHRIIYANIQADDAYLTKYLSKKILMPLAFHPYESDIVYLWYCNRIVLFNFQTRKLEVHTSLLSQIVLSWKLVFTYVVPPWPTPLPQPSWQPM